MTTTTDAVTGPVLPIAAPQRIAEDAWLIPNFVPTGPDSYLFVNSMVILAEEPVVVDTGAPLHREQWLEAVSSVVDPEDIRWIYLSHDDGDHIGNLAELLRLAPNATVVANFFSTERAALEPDRALPVDRMVWLEAGQSLDVGDRRLHLFRPPIFDGPTSRGIYDDRTHVMWAVDSFAAFTTGAVYDAADLPPEMYDGSFALLNSLVAPWHAWLAPEVYCPHVDEVQAMGATTIASAHGPVLTGPSIADAFDRVRAMAGQPIVHPPGQELLDELVAGLLAGAGPTA